MICRSKLGSQLYINYVRLRELTELYQPTYQKSDFILLKKERFKRSSDMRVQALIDNLPSQKGSYLDIGSQLGYFVFTIAERGFLSFGMEMHKVSYDYAMNVKNLNDIDNAHFINLSLDKIVAELLPSFDVISILSVFHHLVHFQGFAAADAIIKTLAAKCRSTFFFETGEYEEKGFYWTDDISFMGNNSKAWIQNYLESAGFKKVRTIATTGTHLTEHKRTLYCCTK